MHLKEERPQKQVKVISTPRIKLKHNDITDEEFRLLMEHQRDIEDVSINYTCIIQILNLIFFCNYVNLILCA